MQKVLLLTLALCFFGQIHPNVISKDKYPFKKTIAMCKKELGITKANYSQHEGRLILCVMQNIGVMNSTGKINPKVLKQKILEMGFPMKYRANEIVKRCAKQTSSNPEKNALKLFYCVKKG